MKSDQASPAPRRGEVTGRMVLFGLLAFFAVVIVVNTIMARFAVSTFGGVETESSYKAGLAFTKEVGAAEKQNSRHWAVDVQLRSLGGEARVITVEAADAAAQPLSSLEAKGRLAHPTDARRDVPLALVPIGAGRYRANADAGPGQWDLVIDFAQGGERVFRSRNRVQLP